MSTKFMFFKEDNILYSEKWDKELESYDKEIKSNPRNSLTYQRKGSLLENLGRMEESLECYDEALEINPQYAPLYYFKGKVLADLNRMEDSISCYTKLIRKNPLYLSEEYFHHANTLLDEEKIEDAVKCYRKVIESVATAKSISSQYFSVIINNFIQKETEITKAENLDDFVVKLFEEASPEDIKPWIPNDPAEKEIFMLEYKGLIERLLFIMMNWLDGNLPIENAELYQMIRKVQKKQETVFSFFSGLYMEYCGNKNSVTQALMCLLREKCKTINITNATFEEVSKYFAEQIDFIVNEFEEEVEKDPNEVFELMNFIDKIKALKEKFETLSQFNTSIFNSFLEGDELIGQYHEDFPDEPIENIEIFLKTFSTFLQEILNKL